MRRTKDASATGSLAAVSNLTTSIKYGTHSRASKSRSQIRDPGSSAAADVANGGTNGQQAGFA
jgi:hypothetical protein